MIRPPTQLVWIASVIIGNVLIIAIGAAVRAVRIFDLQRQISLWC
ncbi:hypothetical protein [Mycobacterium uberis]|nr:hypothetical protein [Mycobacterium uberis]